ncbi:MAG: hypothetical protein QOD68_2543 [Actinomycetota bacterium]|nr:hypothetical protein [Actinomycetota bacterium]
MTSDPNTEPGQVPDIDVPDPNVEPEQGGTGEGGAPRTGGGAPRTEVESAPALQPRDSGGASDMLT